MSARPLRDAISVLCVTLGLVGAVELGCRLTEKAATHPRLTVKVEPRKPGELRVMLFGESTVFGAPLREVGIAKQLGFWLEKIYPTRPVNIVNCGRPSADSERILAIVQANVTQSPDIVVIMEGHNEYLTAHRPSPLQQAIRKHSAVVRRLLPMVSRTEIWPDKVAVWPRDAEFTRRVETYKQNLGAMIDAAGAQHAQVIVSTIGSNLRDWAPVHERLDRPSQPAIEAAVKEIQGSLGEGRLDEAGQRIDVALGAFPGDAMLTWLRGKVRLAKGDTAGARRDFVAARDADPLPYRATTAINDATREVARAKHATLLDVAQVLEGEALPGLDLFVDNCHPAPEGSALIVAALVRRIAETAPDGADRAALSSCCGVEPFLASVHFAGGPLELEYLMESAKYVMKTPFYDFATSRRYLERAAALDPGGWEEWANLATLSFFEGRAADGEADLRKAEAAKGSPIDPEDRKRTPYLKEARALARR